MGKLEFNVILNWCFYKGEGMSGGDRIFIEIFKRLSKKGHMVNVFTNENGLKMCVDNGLDKVRFYIWPSEKFNKFGFYIAGFFRTLIGIKNTLRIKFSKNKDIFVYSSSDFLPDCLPAFLIKIRNPNIKWIAGFYMFAPNPFKKSPYKGKDWIKGLIYWFFQKPAYFLIKKFADMVWVTSEPDVSSFVTSARPKNKILVIRGGIDIKPSEKYLKSNKVVPLEKRRYDACFVGRFHPQKGVLELINIWKLVCKRKKNAKLAMIGIGPLENEVKEKIKKLNLGNNIKLLGFKDGNEKYEIFKQSKIVIHPATYDSGGMAACEAMAWGLPGVSFDLEALKTYYPKGMIKVPCYNLKKFAESILNLLENEKLYKKISKEAIGWAREWNWEKRVNMLEKLLMNLK